MSSFNLIFTVLHECIIPHVSENQAFITGPALPLSQKCCVKYADLAVVGTMASESYKNLPESNFNYSGLGYWEAHLT